MPNDLGDFFNSIPIITRYWFTATIVFPILGRIGIIQPIWMYLDWSLVINKFHFWRPITALMFYPITPQTGFHYLFMLYFLYSYSKSLETGVFGGRPADYLYMLIINWLVSTGICMAMGIAWMLDPMVISVLYVWAQLNRDVIVSFWFGTQFKAIYLPWVLCAFNAILRGGGMIELIGIIIGHFYYFLAFKYPQDHNCPSLLTTPQFLYKYFPNAVGGVHGFGTTPQHRRPAADRDGAHAWGRGQALGAE